MTSTCARNQRRKSPASASCARAMAFAELVREQASNVGEALWRADLGGHTHSERGCRQSAADLAAGGGGSGLKPCRRGRPRAGGFGAGPAAPGPHRGRNARAVRDQHGAQPGGDDAARRRPSAGQPPPPPRAGRHGNTGRSPARRRGPGGGDPGPPGVHRGRTHVAGRTRGGGPQSRLPRPRAGHHRWSAGRPDPPAPRAVAGGISPRARGRTADRPLPHRAHRVLNPRPASAARGGRRDAPARVRLL